MNSEKRQIIVGYERLSTKDQAFNTPAREQQKARLLGAGATEIFEDIESGKNDDRPELGKLMQKVKNREVDVVLITKIDRLARSLPKLRECINCFQEAGVNLIVLDQNIDLATSQGMLMLNILGAVAEMEVALISDRVKHGKQHQRNNQAACEAAPWGYRVVNKKYELDTRPVLCLLEDRPAESSLSTKIKDWPEQNDEAEVVGRSLAQIGREMIEEFLSSRDARATVKNAYDKYGFRKIATTKKRNYSALFNWTKSGFLRWLYNPVLRGHTVYNKTKVVGKKRQVTSPQEWNIISNTHSDQRLLTEEEAKEIQEICTANQKLVGSFLPAISGSSGAKEYYYYQRGLIYCRECGSRCITKTSMSKKKKYFYFACRHFGMGCQNRQSVGKQDIEDFLVKFLVQKSWELRSELGKGEEIEPQKSNRLIELEEQLKVAESFPGFNINNEKLKEGLRQEITDEINLTGLLTNKSVEEIIRTGNNLSFWHTLSDEEKVEVYHKIVQKIFIGQGQVNSILLKTQN
ncbi:fdxN element excision recombinase XisF [Microcoleus vaginatus]|uniref:fdxN element excision recombinase XisF n=1 Tax=Microcoleus vaginatus TaxID=119532 RepID=UPI0032A6FFB0